MKPRSLKPFRQVAQHSPPLVALSPAPVPHCVHRQSPLRGARICSACKQLMLEGYREELRTHRSGNPFLCMLVLVPGTRPQCDRCSHRFEFSGIHAVPSGALPYFPSPLPSLPSPLSQIAGASHLTHLKLQGQEAQIHKEVTGAWWGGQTILFLQLVPGPCVPASGDAAPVTGCWLCAWGVAQAGCPYVPSGPGSRVRLVGIVLMCPLGSSLAMIRGLGGQDSTSPDGAFGAAF